MSDADSKQAMWDQRQAMISRIDDIHKAIHNNRWIGDLYKWRISLESLYDEIYARMTEKEREYVNLSFEVLIDYENVYLISLSKKSRGLKTPVASEPFRSKLTELGRYLSTMERKYGLSNPDKPDIYDNI